VPTRRRTRSVSNQLRGVSPAGIPIVLDFNARICGVSRKNHRVGDRIIPGFIDLQVNGAHGIDVMSATAADLLRLSQHLANEGTTGWLPTVITSSLDRIERIDAVIGEAMAAQKEMEQDDEGRGGSLPGATIVGMHLEGPFISPERLGAHPPLNLLPLADNLERVLRLKNLRLITLAPELDGATDAISMFTTHVVAVSLGHSDASAEQTAAAIAAGARMFTHVFNAMRPLRHRDPGIVAGALLPSRAYAAVIPDGVHADPVMLRLLLHSRSERGVILTSDRAAPADAKGHSGNLFGELIPGARLDRGAIRLLDGTLAGSNITMLEGVRLMRAVAGLEWRGTAATTAANPAAVLALRDRGTLRLRTRADLLLLDSRMNLKAVFVGGRNYN
jgi:N-acetylglucosamine-6-phosphate deacetylase